jgi:hypothetical protein
MGWLPSFPGTAISGRWRLVAFLALVGDNPRATLSLSRQPQPRAPRSHTDVTGRRSYEREQGVSRRTEPGLGEEMVKSMRLRCTRVDEWVILLS